MCFAAAAVSTRKRGRMPADPEADATPPEPPTVLVRRDGRVGRITLNRPKALNALDLPMIRDCAAALAGWAADPAVHAVVIDGAGNRAFCAGGDIRAIRAHAMADEMDAV